MSEQTFDYDAFLSCAEQDVQLVGRLAAALRDAGLNVWFKDGAHTGNIARSPEYYLDRSRTLVVFLTEAASKAWSSIEGQTLRFRDPLAESRRLVVVRLDASPAPAQLGDMPLLDLSEGPEKERVAKLLAICSAAPKQDVTPAKARKRVPASVSTPETMQSAPRSAFVDSTGRVFVGSGAELKVITGPVEEGKQASARIIAQLPHSCEFLSADSEQTVLVAGSARRFTVLSFADGELVLRSASDLVKGTVASLATNGNLVGTGQEDGLVRLWQIEGGALFKVLRGHNDRVGALILLKGVAVSGSHDRTIRVWNLANGRCLRVLEGHTGAVRALRATSNAEKLLSGGADGVVRLWDFSTGLCIRAFSGHTAPITALSWSAKTDRYFVSSAEDLTSRIWDSETGACVAVLDGLRTDVKALGWSLTGDLISVDLLETRTWPLRELVPNDVPARSGEVSLGRTADQVLYTNAKVLLVGDSGAGKTGLSKRLALGIFELSASTVGAWATQWKLPVAGQDGAEREIWLWDFGGQADQRIIHQLYMDETALVVLVFDGQKAEVFESLVQWDNDLRRSTQADFTKLLVAGRIDASPLRVSRANLESFCSERGYAGLFLTSAMTGDGCSTLKAAIVSGIDWERIPWRSSPRLFKVLKEEIVALKDQGKVLMRFPDLREMLILKMQGREDRFTDDQLKAVISLLAGPGVITALAFGGWILFQPHLINVYAQAVLRTMLEDPSELGCILESDVLAGNLSFHDLERVSKADETFILLEMHHTLLQRGLCSAEQTERGPLLVFPSYYKRQRPELRGHPAVLVSYIFEGFVPEVYSTLVVRLHHTDAFTRDGLWQDAADFKTSGGRQIGLKLRKGKDGKGVIEVYADPEIPVGEKILFIRYVHEHLRQRALAVHRRRHYVCPSCAHPIVDFEAAELRLQRGKKDIGCPACDYRFALVDDIEQMYGSPAVMRQVQGLDDVVELELDNESKERVLVAEVMSAVARAVQIMREKNVSDHGIDAELEFKDDQKQATGQMLYLQMKSGDSYIRTDAGGREIFSIKKRRHAQYWMDQNFPVMLVVRSSEGDIRWMEIREYLKEEYKGRRLKAKQQRRDPDHEDVLPDKIEFAGEPFDVGSILRWRARMLGARASGSGSRRRQ